MYHPSYMVQIWNAYRQKGREAGPLFRMLNYEAKHFQSVTYIYIWIYSCRLRTYFIYHSKLFRSLPYH
jgi:hypothetical protein